MSLKMDASLIKEIEASGSVDVNRCYHCGNCTAACPLSTRANTFPRRYMKYVQMGLREKIKASPEPWLCFQCNDCSVKCPRDAKPGDVMAVLRKQALVEYGTPKFLARFVSDGSLLNSLLVAVVVIALTLLIRFPLEAVLKPVLDAFDKLVGMHPHTGTVVYAHFFPHWLLIGLFTIATGFTMFNGILGIFKFWKDMAENDSKSGVSGSKKGLVGSTVKVLTDIMVHKKFGDCGTAPSRKSSHLILVLGFIALFIVTSYAVFSLYVLKVYPFSMLHPMKILGNLGGVALLAGVIIMIMNRKNNPKEMGIAGSFDWSFLWVILGVGITGFLTQFLRFSGPASMAYANYFIHLIFVFYLLVYLPYSKFGHILYRTVALVYMEASGRNGTAITATPPVQTAAPSENIEQSAGSESRQAE